jgi:hypothetical protein
MAAPTNLMVYSFILGHSRAITATAATTLSIVHHVEPRVIRLIADIFVATAEQDQRLVGACLLGADRQLGDGL